MSNMNRTLEQTDRVSREILVDRLDKAVHDLLGILVENQRGLTGEECRTLMERVYSIDDFKMGVCHTLKNPEGWPTEEE